MAADWIKMRTDLYRDPRVCVMADLLMNEDGELARYVNQHCQRHMTVTRNVMRNVTVGALVSVWGVMRLRGKAEGDDLVCRAVTTSVLDDIADLPGLGAAMESVGWVLSTEEGLVFPRFFEDHNVDPDASPKSKSAARQQRYRERQKQESDVTRDVTRDGKVTPREEKRREEEKIKEPPISPQAEPEKAKRTSTITATDLQARGVEPQLAADFLALRAKKRAPFTLTALTGIEREAVMAGVSLNAALRTVTERGWQSFKAEWVGQAAAHGRQLGAGIGPAANAAQVNAEAKRLVFGGSRQETIDV
jgi:hypothetical protein